jgi:GNAT superfamily N-acetyltransferase
MPAILSVSDNLQPYLQIPGFEVTPAQLARQRPDEMLLAGDGSARCGLWYRQAPHLPGHRVGVVGHYYALTEEAGVAVLREGCARLADAGCTLAVGPMDGTTWERYRLITERGDEPPFFLEPDNPEDWPAHFLAAGFSPFARYCSAVCEDLSGEVPPLRDPAITIRTVNLSNFTDELRRLHRLSLLAFAGNLLYAPISEAGFLAMYEPARAFVRPELVLLAEKGDELVGFMFAVPDLLQKARGREIDTAIVKTMATHPAHAGRGLGSHLMARAHAACREAGHRRVIHALFHEENLSGRISRHTARVFRSYTLFARPLGGAP